MVCEWSELLSQVPLLASCTIACGNRLVTAELQHHVTPLDLHRLGRPPTQTNLHLIFWGHHHKVAHAAPEAIVKEVLATHEQSQLDDF